MLNIKQLTMLSLFSGIGGIDLAAEWAGIQTVAFCEMDPFCQKILKKHWPMVPVYGDIKKLRGEDIGTVGEKHPEYIGTYINPLFLEWMMGFPIGWTEVDRQEML